MSKQDMLHQKMYYELLVWKCICWFFCLSAPSYGTTVTDSMCQYAINRRLLYTLHHTLLTFWLRPPHEMDLSHRITSPQDELRSLA